MPLPIPEGILHSVLRAVPGKDLANHRLVSRQINGAATQLLFEQLNISYGYDRSRAQMKGLIASGLCPLIKTVFVPSESFFRRMDRWLGFIGNLDSMKQGLFQDLSSSTTQTNFRGK
ncbi:hypothetical protein TWF751_006825 [Orbilia oligospora]|nr:hypothetical protein TWF751_006825 [Orbilia oligospora]